MTAYLYWRGQRLGEVEGVPAELAERMLELNEVDALEDAVTFNQLMWKDDPRGFYRHVVGGWLQDWRFSDFVQQMIIQLLGRIRFSGRDCEAEIATFNMEVRYE